MNNGRSRLPPRGVSGRALGALCLTLSVGIVVQAAASPDKAREGLVAREDLEIVDCLLPGDVRQLGNTTFVTRRRPTRTTASDCRIRGGEYTAYSRSDYKSALRVWLEAAQAGDAAAQNNVGEIYERGLGDKPNYEVAVIWYQKAADQGYSRALFNLATLYEQGFGVTQDKVKALNLYRKAWGIPDGELIDKAAADQENARLRNELQDQVKEKDTQIQALQSQIEQLQGQIQKQIAREHKADAQMKSQAETLQHLMDSLRTDRERSQVRLAQLPGGAAPVTGPPPDPQALQHFVKGLDFGRYYAIVIGNQNYANLESLQTPRTDAERAAQLLRDKYGFNVRILEDASDDAMLSALNDLNKILKDNDNVLIYYAGHGSRQKTPGADIGYWLPVNAEPPPSLRYWVGNDQISSYLGVFRAKRVLVVADSCYAGLLSSDPELLVFRDKTQEKIDYLKYKLPKRARLLLASGGDNPVLDVGGDGHSVFARAFLDVLQENTELLSAPALFARMQERVKAGATHNNFQQVPELKSIRSAGHEVGDFFFVPKSAG